MKAIFFFILLASIFTCMLSKFFQKNTYPSFAGVYVLDTKYPLQEDCCNITSLKVTNSSKSPNGDSKRNISYYNFEFDWPITCNISYGANITGNLSYPEWWVRTGNEIGSISL